MGRVVFNFEGEHYLVTGGASGLGFQMAQDLLASHAQVTIWDYSADALEAASQKLETYASRLSLAPLDVTNREHIRQAAQNLKAPLNGLINNAGITRDKSFAKMSAEDFDQVVATNLTGVFNITQTLLDRFVADGPKRIINLASVVALYGNFGQTNYVATKAGVIGMTKTWAKELGRKGFTVNAVAPGFIMTSMTAAMPEEVLNNMKSKVPVGRLGSPQDISNICLYLLSNEASYVNGAVVSVDGGIVL